MTIYASNLIANLQLADRTCSNAERFLRPCAFPWWAATTRRSDRPRPIRSEFVRIFVGLRPSTNRQAPQPHQEQPLVDKGQHRERVFGVSASTRMVARHANKAPTLSGCDSRTWVGTRRFAIVSPPASEFLGIENARSLDEVVRKRVLTRCNGSTRIEQENSAQRQTWGDDRLESRRLHHDASAVTHDGKG